MPEENVNKFCEVISPEDCAILGKGREYVKCVGNELVVDAFKYLEFGFWAAAMHVARTPKRKIRESICEAGNGSLVQALKAYAMHGVDYSERDGLLRKIDELNHAWEVFFDNARCFQVEQSKNSANETIPETIETMKLMYDLDMEIEGSPFFKDVRRRLDESVTLKDLEKEFGKDQITMFKNKYQNRAVFALALFTGRRAGEISLIRTSTFKPDNTGTFHLLIPSKDNPNELVLKITSRSRKIEKYGLRLVTLPEDASKWILDFEKYGRPLFEPDHSGLFCKPRGGPLDDKIVGKKGKTKFDHNGIFNSLRHHYGEERVKDLKNFTQLRAIFYNVNSATRPGTLLNLIANSKSFGQRRDGSNKRSNEDAVDLLALMRSDVALPGEEDLVRAMEFHNMSSQEQASIHYSERCFNSIKMLVLDISHMKNYLWDKFREFDNRKVARH